MGKYMKSVVVLMFLVLSAFAQNEPWATVMEGCGPKDKTFDVKLDRSKHALAQPDSGKALVYFIQDFGEIACIGKCGTTRIGLDGDWVGVIQHNSYFSAAVDAGEHHVCAYMGGQRLAFAHLTAEAGKVYYFRTRDFTRINQGVFDLDALDEDEAKYLIYIYPLAVSHPKP
jgi:hypothetical protein